MGGRKIRMIQQSVLVAQIRKCRSINSALMEMMVMLEVMVNTNYIYARITIGHDTILQRDTWTSNKVKTTLLVVIG